MLTQQEAMTVVWYGGTVTRRSWFGDAVVYLDKDKIPIKVYQDGTVEIYDESQDLNTDDWENVV